MRRGQQDKVVTPGTNEKRYLAGSLNWRTGALILTAGLPKEGRSAALFIRHLDIYGGACCATAKFTSSVICPQP